MSRILRSATFKRQLIDITKGYRARAGATVALQFVDQVDASIRFIAAHPLACAIYTELDGNAFRKWGLKSFPVSLFFRIDPDGAIRLEALYAHRMNIADRLMDDIDSEA